MDEKTLEEKEGRAYKLFLNSRKKNRLANSYLLAGEENSPLKEVALYLAMSLNCETSLFGCGHCPSCLRFQAGVRPDFVLIDGSTEPIKKEQIQDLEKKFSLSALEKNHRLSYVIHHVENITEEAANSLLKFLEEPKAGQIAFLTTTSPARVLNTIKSRCIQVPIDPYGTKELEEELSKTEFPVGKKKTLLPAGECYILSHLTPSKEEAFSLFGEDSFFHQGYQMAEAVLSDYLVSDLCMSNSLLLQTSRSKSSLCYNWMIQILLFVLEESLKKEETDSSFADIEKKLSQDPERTLRGVELLRDILSNRNLNYNPTLSSARLLRALRKE